jgi:hypothetical protein
MLMTCSTLPVFDGYNEIASGFMGPKRILYRNIGDHNLCLPNVPRVAIFLAFLTWIITLIDNIDKTSATKGVHHGY